MKRRRLLGALASALGTQSLPQPVLAAAASAEGLDRGSADRIAYPEVTAGTRLAFPRDHGAHPDYRVEWWYVTGWLHARGRPEQAIAGFQVTFFRARPPYVSDNPSGFAPRQVIIAHAAVADPQVGHLLHDQRIARAGFGLAEARTTTTDVRIDDWHLALVGEREPEPVYRARIPARDFDLQLALVARTEPLLHGEAGYSRKGRLPAQASYYYSRPQLAVSGSLRTGRGSGDVEGIAWLDHEWSSQYMDDAAVGWDWTGIHLDGGGALMAFRMRGSDGRPRWAAGTLQQGGALRTFTPEEVAFEPRRRWRSARTGAEYPVAMEVRCGARTWTLQPLMDDQELDSRSTTGAVYWEGAVRALAAGRVVGRGYLELTGYVTPIRI